MHLLSGVILSRGDAFITVFCMSRKTIIEFKIFF